jgi:hypothetical protein
LAAAKTKDAAIKERDKVNKAYKAVTAQLLAENRAKLPAAAAFADWLATNPSPDDRHAAVMMINNTLIAVDGMEDPIPEDLHDLPPSTFHQLRAATLAKKTTSTQPKQKDDAAMITINIASHEDAARLPALLAAVMSQFGASIPSCGPAPVAADPYEHVAKWAAATAPLADVKARLLQSPEVKAEYDAITTQAAEPVEEKAKRTRKAKAEAEAPVTAEPVIEAPVVAEPATAEPVVEAQPVEEEAAKTYTDKDVLAALQAFARTPGGVQKIKEILAGFGATNLASIKPEDYAAVISLLVEQVAAMLASGTVKQEQYDAVVAVTKVPA